MSDPSKEVDEIHQIIDNMQARLAELFDQLRELRTRLNHRTMPIDNDTVLPLFSKIKESEELSEPESNSKKTDEVAIIPPVTPSGDHMDPEDPPVDSSAPSEVRVSRFLDPITHELKTGTSPAEVIAEYLQAAKDELITSSTLNEKVERDMDIVLKFLRARGRRGIRTEERDNILRRIKRWEAHLGKS